MILPNVKDVVSIILTMKMMILCCVITVKSAGIMGLSQLDFEDLRGYAIMIKVLFICHGNICRSTMAQFVFQDMVNNQGLKDKFYIDSAATSREEIGNPPHHGTVNKLRQEGIPVLKHRAIQMTKQDYEEYDYIIGMDAWNLRNMNRITGGDPDGKIHLLLDYSKHPRDIADPWYTGNFDDTYRDVVEGCKAFLEYLKQEEL